MSRSVWKHIWKGAHERPEIDAASKLVRAGDRILELGSGMGIVSGVASRLQENLTVEAFEANPNLIAAILKLHILNGITNVTVHNAILLPVENEGQRRLNLHMNFTESSILNTPSSNVGVDVEVRDFRKVLATVCPDVLICDIEGGEEELFVGVDLTGIRALVIELHPDIISRAAIKRIYDAAAAAGLYPRIELSSLRVVAFERVDI